MVDFFLYFGLFLNYFKKWTQAQTFFKSGPFESRQYGWRDSWRSRAICTGAIRRGGACPGVDVVPRRAQSRQSDWRNWVTPPAVVRLAGPANLWHVSTSVPIRLAWLVKILNWCQLSSSSLSSLFLSQLSLARVAPPSPPPPGLSQPPLIPKAGPRCPPRLLLTLNCVDFILTSFID
jgi:hypothetical protein